MWLQPKQLLARQKRNETSIENRTTFESSKKANASPTPPNSLKNANVKD